MDARGHPARVSGGRDPSSRAEAPFHLEGFDGRRLLAAVLVIFSHAFLIATGTEDSEPLVRLLGSKPIAGLYGVFTFFIISGFLLARSLHRNPDAVSYMVNRVCRIIPAFAVSTFLLAFVVGPIFSSLPARAFFASGEVMSFVVNSLDGLRDWTLPMLFAIAGSSGGLLVGDAPSSRIAVWDA